MIKQHSVTAAFVTAVMVIVFAAGVTLGQRGPLETCKRNLRTDENIELFVSGKQVFLVGPGAEDVLDMMPLVIEGDVDYVDTTID